MKLKTREAAGVTVFDISGEMYGGPDSMKLVEEVTRLAEEKRLDLILNLAKVKHIPSTGLGVLIVARSRYAKGGGVMKLVNPNQRVLSILELTRLNLLFDVFSTEEEALESFKAG